VLYPATKTGASNKVLYQNRERILLSLNHTIASIFQTGLSTVSGKNTAGTLMFHDELFRKEKRFLGYFHSVV